jgi:RND family efflux transporter MFP subunit
VTVAAPLQETVTEYLEFSGNTAAVEEVEVRARVSGFLESIHFTPGTQVKEGDLLFVIDPREYVAELNAAKAEVTSARAQLERANIELDRAKRLFKQKAGAEADVVKWQGERDVSAAAVIRAKAKVERAQLNVDYTQVTAPISGRVSRNYVDLGNLVGEKEPTLLTTITQSDPMYAYFNLNERNLLQVLGEYRKRVQEKGIDPTTDSGSQVDIPLELGLTTEEGYPHEGKFDFAESGVDPGTGTLQIRGIFPNPGPLAPLLPGLFTRIRMPVSEKEDALLVSERAVGSDQGGQYLMVVGSDNTVEKKPVVMGQLVDGLRVIEEGIEPGERVVVNGLQRARPGGKIDPTEIDMAALKTSAIRAAAETEKQQQSPPGGDGQTKDTDADKNP